jgi:hypothetical protein
MAKTDEDNRTAEELRDRARALGIPRISKMRKDELRRAVESAERGKGSAPKGGTKRPAGGGGGGSRSSARDVTATRGTKYAQEITSPDEHEERTGRSLVTTDHDVIREWAEERDAVPATINGTEHGDHLGVLRFDFGGDSENERLRHVSWDEWFRTFDDRKLNFIYQEHRTDGSDSNFFRLDNPDREDA